MRKNEVRIVSEIGQESVVLKSAFEKVWAARGWVKKEIDKVEADVEAEIELVESEIAGSTPPPAPAVPPAVPPVAAARLGKADGGTGTPESNQTTS